MPQRPRRLRVFLAALAFSFAGDALPAGQDARPQKQSEWIEIADLSLSATREALRSALDAVNAAEDEDDVRELDAEFRREMRANNAEWEEREQVVVHARSLAQRELFFQRTNLATNTAEIGFNNSSLDNYKRNRVDYEALLRELRRSETMASQSLNHLDATAYRTYFLIYVDTPVPEQERESNSQLQLAELLRQAAYDWVKDHALQDHLESREVLIDSRYAGLFTDRREGIVTPLASPEMFWLNRSPPVFGALFAILVQPAVTPLALQEPSPSKPPPEWLDARIESIIELSMDPEPPPEFDIHRVPPARSMPFSLALDASQIARAEDMTDQLRSFQTPDAYERWSMNIVEAAIRLEAIKRRMQQTIADSEAIDRQIVETEETLRALDEARAGIEAALLGANRVFDEQDAVWQKHVLSRNVLYVESVEDNKGDLPQGDAPQQAKYNLLDRFYDRMLSQSRVTFLRQNRSLIDVDGALRLLEDEHSTEAGARVRRAKIIYRFENYQANYALIGLAIEVNFRLPSDVLIPFNTTPVEWVRAIADINIEEGTVSYNELTYAPLDTGEYGMSYDAVIDQINELNARAYLNRSDWRLPTREELDAVRYISVGDSGPTRYTAFPELGIGPDRPYWTRDEAPRDFEDRFWATFFGITKRSEPVAVSSAGLAVIVSSASLLTQARTLFEEGRYDEAERMIRLSLAAASTAEAQDLLTRIQRARAVERTLRGPTP